MSHIWRVAWTIARRDYVAAVFSRLFLIFLLLPVIFGAVGGVFGTIGARDDVPPPRAVVAVSGSADAVAALLAARARIADRLGDDVVPPFVHRDGTPSRLFAAGIAAVLTGGLDRPNLALAADAPGELEGQVALIVDDARAARALGAAGPPMVTITRASAGATASPDRAHDALWLARGTQYVVMILTIMLSGRLLSSFIEERSNKVIEVLAAVAPVDAIFLGKLIGMLLFSLTCIVGWGAILFVGALAFAPDMLTGLPTPAIGWFVFAVLMPVYFSLCFLLFGSMMLGLGAQANSPADIQTLALPMTIAQMMMLGLASVDVASPDHGVPIFAAIFPWSSPLAMLARGVERAAIWPHLIAILWLAGWLALAIRLAARRFRRAVLKSGGGRSAKVGARHRR